jgi:ubiquinone/menaquinone biosynthesis C-methylase UbiE
MNDFQRYYNSYNEDIRLTRTKAREIEFLTNIEFLNRHISSSGKVLDVGAGTGAYSFYYANNGYDVTALDYADNHVKTMKEKLKDNQDLTMSIDVGNVLDLSRFEDNIFDVVICFGPIYHLRSGDDRIQCISECNRVLKDGGILAVAYISKFHIIPRNLLYDDGILIDSTIG